MPALLEAKHLQIRNEAVSLYVSMYESVMRGYGPEGLGRLNDSIAAVRPAVRTVITSAISELTRSGGVFKPVVSSSFFSAL